MSEGVESLHAEEVRIVEDILVCCSVVAGDFLSDSAVDAFAEVVDMAALDAIEIGFLVDLADYEEDAAFVVTVHCLVVSLKQALLLHQLKGEH
jgi:hypothetical protein